MPILALSILLNSRCNSGRFSHTVPRYSEKESHNEIHKMYVCAFMLGIGPGQSSFEYKFRISWAFVSLLILHVLYTTWHISLICAYQYRTFIWFY